MMFLKIQRNKVTNSAEYTTSNEILTYCKQRKQNVVLVSATMSDMLKQIGVVDAAKNLGPLEAKGANIVCVNKQMQKNMDKTWTMFQSLFCTNDKAKPALGAFHYNSEAGEIRHGYYNPKEKKVYVNIDYPDNMETYIEEIIHHTTGASDYTREFQHAAMQIIARLMKGRRF